MKSIQKIVAFSIFGSIIALHGMGKNEVQSFSPIASLKSLATTVIARQINPHTSVVNALNAFNSQLFNHSDIAHSIAEALAQQEQPTLRTILRSQRPLLLNIKRFKQFPENLYPLTNNGLYVRSKKDGYNPDMSDPLYAGVAQLIPDPLAQNAPTQFFQIYSNPNGTKYFDDMEAQYRAAANSPGICIWDKKTGACVNDGKAICKKLLAKYPQIANPDPELHDFFLYGICPDDSIAWCRFIYNSDQRQHQAVCAFHIESNKLLHVALGVTLGQHSYSGKLCTLLETNNHISIMYTNHSRKMMLSNGNFIISGISPQDDYLLLMHQIGTDILNLKSKKLHPLTLNNQPLYLSNGIYNPLNVDGTLLANLKENQIYILKVHTNELICTFPAPNADEEDTHYRLLFNPDSTQLLTLKVSFAPSKNYDNTYYHLKVFDIASQGCVEELDEQQIANGDDATDFILCNEGDYLLLPNRQLLLRPQGLVRRLSPKELLGLLILEKQKTEQLPANPFIIALLKQNPIAQIRELINRRYNPS